ncbi:hypothetical protein BU15DRAFT_52602 [Melanogaster broomeanus]|nr:hypothetical protein BU15DRAFT_52602 [Melanogaster broomeanus]
MCIQGAYVIVVFGRTGTGISSVVNLISGRADALCSGGSNRCTKEIAQYEANIDSKKIHVYDIPGFGGGERELPDNEIITTIVDIHRKQVIGLLVQCLGPRGGISHNDYLSVTSAVGPQVPIAAVVTHLEREGGEMDDWWLRNAEKLASKKMMFVDHACVTTIPVPSNDAQWGRRKMESEKAVRDLISRNRNGIEPQVETGATGSHELKEDGEHRAPSPEVKANSAPVGPRQDEEAKR